MRGEMRFRLPTGKLGLWLAVFVATIGVIGGSASSAGAAAKLGLAASPDDFGLEEDWDAIEHSGSDVVHMQFNCDTGWLAYDPTIKKAAERGVEVMAYFFGSAGTREFPRNWNWTSTLICMSEAVVRYGEGGTYWQNNPSVNYNPITLWEVWNEPNRNENNPPVPSEGNPPQPRAYGELLEAAYPVIHSAANGRQMPNNAKVIFGGLWTDQSIKKPAAMEAVPFLEQASEGSSLSSYYDGLSIHPYANKQEKKGEKLTGMKSGVEAIRTAMTKVGSGGKPIYVTEVGWPVADPQNEIVPVSELDQAWLLKESIDWLQTQTDVALAAWYVYQDHFKEGTWAEYCGLRDSAGVYRTSWFAFQQQTGAPSWESGKWNVESVGVTSPSPVGLTSWKGNKRWDLFFRGEDNNLYHRYWLYPTGYSSWEKVGSAKLTTGPSATNWGSDKIDVMASTNVGNNVDHWYWNSGWKEEYVGVTSKSEPDLTSWDYGRYDMFFRGEDNNLYHRYWTLAGGWSTWEAMESNLSSAPEAASWGPGRLDVMATVGAERQLYHWWWDNTVGGGWHKEKVGVTTASAPALTSPSPASPANEEKRLDMFFRGEDNNLYHRFFTTLANWSNWETVSGGGTLSTGPEATSWDRGQLDVMASTGSGNNLYHWYWTP